MVEDHQNAKTDQKFEFQDQSKPLKKTTEKDEFSYHEPIIRLDVFVICKYMVEDHQSV